MRAGAETDTVVLDQQHVLAAPPSPLEQDPDRVCPCVLAHVGECLLRDARDLQLRRSRELEGAAVVLKQQVQAGLPAEALGQLLQGRNQPFAVHGGAEAGEQLPQLGMGFVQAGAKARQIGSRLLRRCRPGPGSRSAS